MVWLPAVSARVKSVQATVPLAASTSVPSTVTRRKSYRSSLETRYLKERLPPVPTVKMRWKAVEALPPMAPLLAERSP